MLRWAAAGSLQMLPIQHRYALLAALIKDDAAAVRLEVAQMLAEVPVEQIGPGDAAQLNALFTEYLDVLGQHADIPEAQLEMGVFLVGRRLFDLAERAYRNAMTMNPQLLAAYLNLADLYRVTSQEDRGREVLLQAVEVAPREAATWEALGLLETRAGNRIRALEYLQKSASLETTGVRHRYVYAVALQDAGRTEDALSVLRNLLREAPRNPDVLLALATYAKAAGQDEEARRYGERLLELMPEDPGVRQFYETL